MALPERANERASRVVGVRFFLFDREADALRSNMRAAGLGDLTAAEARKILNNIAGVAIYRSGFRIRPYGDPDNDWLTLDKRRVQNPSLHIGHNQIAGYISVEDQDDSALRQLLSRRVAPTAGLCEPDFWVASYRQLLLPAIDAILHPP